MSESELQQQCFKWFKWQYPDLKGLLFHVPNGGNRSKREAKRFKNEGVVSGIPDLLFLYLGELHAIEMKKPAGGFTKGGNPSKKGVVSKEQKEIHKIWAKHNVDVFVCYSLESFQEFVVNIVT